MNIRLKESLLQRTINAFWEKDKNLLTEKLQSPKVLQGVAF